MKCKVYRKTTHLFLPVIFLLPHPFFITRAYGENLRQENQLLKEQLKQVEEELRVRDYGEELHRVDLSRESLQRSIQNDKNSRLQRELNQEKGNRLSLIRHRERFRKNLLYPGWGDLTYGLRVQGYLRSAATTLLLISLVASLYQTNQDYRNYQKSYRRSPLFLEPLYQRYRSSYERSMAFTGLLFFLYTETALESAFSGPSSRSTSGTWNSSHNRQVAFRFSIVW